MKIFYHGADLDGWCCGAMVKMEHPQADLIAVQYGDAFPFEAVEEGEPVWILDFSWDACIMRQISQYCPVTWIDHHKTAIEAMEREFMVPLMGAREVGVGACALVHQYLWPDYPVQRAVQLLAQYDVFDFSDDAALPFQYGMRIHMPDPRTEMDPWIALFEVDDDCELWKDWERRMVHDGECILRYLKQSNQRLQGMAIETEFAGYPALAVNQGLTNSLLFEGHPRLAEFPLRITYVRRQGYWTVSLYSDTIDVSAIAWQYGGGGHQGAAGFRCMSLPFEV